MLWELKRANTVSISASYALQIGAGRLPGYMYSERRRVEKNLRSRRKPRYRR